jgi:hypothetical protein
MTDLRKPLIALCFILLGAGLLDACSSDGSELACTPGETVACACLGGDKSGVQTCREDGKGLTACECPQPSGAGGAANGAGGSGLGGAGQGGTTVNSGGSTMSSQGGAGQGGAGQGGAGQGGAGQGGAGQGGAGQGGAGQGGGSASCSQMTPNPATGQICPLFSACQSSAACGVNQGCQLWFCYKNKCTLDPLSNCGKTAGGGCQADVVVTHHDEPPVDKDFMAPDNVDFREIGSLVFTVKNNTTQTLHLKQVPLALDLGGMGSTFDVDAAKMFLDGGGADHESGDLLVCSQNDPFLAPANGKLSTGCGSSPHTGISPNGGTKRFLINIAFEKTKTYIKGRSYRLRIPSSSGFELAVGKGGPTFNGTVCGFGNNGFDGAWAHAK